MKGFEEYAADQFPMRDDLRGAKAFFSTKLLGKADNNGLFFKDGHISKIDTAENDYMTDYSANLFKKIIDSNIVGKNANIYFSIVPDKNAHDKANLTAKQPGDYPEYKWNNEFIKYYNDKIEY